MAFKVNNLFDNPNIKQVDAKGNVKVFEYQKDLSVSAQQAFQAYYAAEMNVRKRQALITLNNSSFVVQAGAMQWALGNIKMTSGIKGGGDFLKKAVASKVAKESTIKPEYVGVGYLMLEPTYNHIILLDVDEWGGHIVLEDGLFMACDASLKHKVVSRTNLSSAVLGGEGLFNLSLAGSGIAVLESPVPQDDLILIKMRDDELKIDGNMAIAWSNSLEFSVEMSSKNIVTSAVSKEGMVNVYRGSGMVLMAPTSNTAKTQKEITSNLK